MSLEVIKVVGLVTLQGARRVGRMHEGLSHGGPLVPSLAARANRQARNDLDATVIEICGRLVVRASEPHRIATDREEIELREGEQIEIASAPARVTYLAVRGGIDAPVVLGSTGAHLSAGIGALLRAGDRIAIGDRATADRATADRAADADDRASDAADADGADDADAASIRVVPGPDLYTFAPDAFDAFRAIEWRVSSSSNRVGTRLEGPAIISRRSDIDDPSRPMVIGAIEVPRDGAPIVLGPEHPTTGGYPVLAVVASDSLDAFHAIPLGGNVRFRAG